MPRKRKRYDNREYEDYQEEPEYPSDVKQPDFDGAWHYERKGDLGWDTQRYWKHRYSMFSRYDEGIWTTESAWFEVTPEKVANKIGQHVVSARPVDKPIIIDVFAGVGGNAIAFALTGKFKRVYAIEKDRATLECGKRNAEIYGVSAMITWFHGDCFEILGVDDAPKDKKVNEVEALAKVIQQYGIIFASPPWGGPEYKEAGAVFDLNTMPYSLEDIYSRLSTVTKQLIMYLPRTSDLNQVAAHVEEGKKAQVVHYCIHENSKAMCVYFGDWKAIASESIS